MPELTSVTFRDQTTGRINDLLMDEGQACAQSQNLLAYLVGAVLNYKDEGIEFSPSIIFCDNIQQVTQAFPGSVTHVIGRAPLDPASGLQILKDCAPLSGRNWFIFIERGGNGIVNYGVFTYFRLPTAIPLHEGITIRADVFSILIRKISSTTIKMRDAKGSILSTIFSTIRESLKQGTPIQKFSDNCSSEIAESTRQEFSVYLSRLLEATLTTCHGTMLVCGNAVDLSEISEMQDAVPVTPKLDFYSAFSEYQAAATAGSILALQRCEELLSNFFRCDGIVVFDTIGQVTAYRVFYRPIGPAPSISSGIVGGARRRAFEGVKSLVGKHLISVLFRSQDGLTLHHGNHP